MQRTRLSLSSLPITILVTALYVIPFYFFVTPVIQFYWFVVGIILGNLLLYFDKKLLWKWYNSPDEPHPMSITHSLLFLGIFIPLLIFIVSSSGNMVGVGLVLSMALQYSLQLVSVWQQPELLLHLFPSHSPVTWKSREIRTLTLVFWGIFVALSLLVIVGNSF